MKSTSLALAAFVLPLLVTPGELRIEYVEGRAVTFESEDWTTLEPRVASARLNGQELPAEAAGQLAASFPSERKDARLSWTLVLSQVENGRPLAGRRRYDVLERRVEKGGEERTMEGALVGRTLRLHAKEDAEVEATLVPLEGAPAVDPRHLEDQRLRDLVEVVLPGRAVTLGDHWKLEEEDARILLGQEGAPRLFAEDLEQQAFRELVHEHAGFGAEVRYEADELRDGIACALLVVESRLELEGREVDPVVLGAGGLPAGSRMRGEMALELRLSARVWLALDERRPVARESEIEGLLALDLSIDQPGAALELRIESKMAGEESARWSFSD